MKVLHRLYIFVAFILPLLLFAYEDGQVISVGMKNPISLTYRSPDKDYAKAIYIDPSRAAATHRIDRNTLRIVTQEKFDEDDFYARMGTSEHGDAELLDYWVTEKDKKLYVLREMKSFLSPHDPGLATLLQSYYDLFLDPFEKMALNGITSETLTFIKNRLYEITQHKLQRHDLNTALLTLEQNKLQEYQNLEVGDKFSPFWFRQFDRDPSNLVLSYRKNIETLKNELQSRRRQIQILEARGSDVDDYEKASLVSMQKGWKSFESDTQLKILEQQNRAEFILSHPDFFKINPKPRYQILGMAPLDLWKEAIYKKRKKMGDGITVGIVDSFSACVQDSAILSKAINPQFIGQGCAAKTHPSHGLHVAGIVVSDRFPKQQQTAFNDITIGMAPNARFEMFSFQTLEALEKNTSTIPPVAKEHRKQWTPEAISEAIDTLFREGIVSVENNGVLQNVDLSRYETNPIVTSQAQVFNYSMGMSSYEPPALFPGINRLPVIINTIKRGRLWVFAAGNDGADLSSRSLEARLIKSLAINSHTLHHIIMVTNLMEDGLTLKPSSNIPGSNVRLQNRTLSAPGTNIRSTTLSFNSDTEKSFEYMSGTSMAAPHVSGIAAIVLSNYPELSAKQLSDCLLKGATPILVTSEGVPYLGDEITPGDQDRGRELYGMGRVNLFGALEQAHILYPQGPRWYF